MASKCSEYPHTFFRKLNEQSQKEIEAEPWTVDLQSDLCLHYFEMLSKGVSENDARQDLEVLVQEEVSLSAITACLATKQLIMLRNAGCPPEDPMCAEIYAAYDRKMDLEAQGIYESLTCKHGPKALTLSSEASPGTMQVKESGESLRTTD